MKKIISLLLFVLIFGFMSNDVFAQKSQIMTCYSNMWTTSVDNSGYDNSIMKFNFKNLTYQRTTNGVTYTQHKIFDYQSGTINGEIYVVMWVYAPGSDLVKVAAYDRYIYEYYGDDSSAPYVVFYLYDWK